MCVPLCYEKRACDQTLRAGWTLRRGLFMDNLGEQRVLVMELTKPPSHAPTNRNQQLHLIRLKTVSRSLLDVMDPNKARAGNGYEVWSR